MTRRATSPYCKHDEQTVVTLIISKDNWWTSLALYTGYGY